jgi:Methyltransferase domain
MRPEQNKLDAIAAYDLIAPAFQGISDRRRAYLDAVDASVISKIPKPARSLLDVGAGDGRRGLKIGAVAGIREITLAEPSSRMRALIPEGCETWDAAIQDLPPSSQRFDCILCLWNVLGHVPSSEQRLATLKNLAHFCSGSGVIFVDVLNRYNIAECGLLRVAGRWLRDTLLPSEENGDVDVTWTTNENEVRARGHVFTAKETAELFDTAGLSVRERIVADYRTGQQRRWITSGNPLYVLRPKCYSNQSLR